MLPTSGIQNGAGAPYNIVELPVTLTRPVTLPLSPFCQIACDLFNKTIDVALGHYNEFDKETQEALNEQCVLVSQGTKIGGLFGINFIDLLKSAATCVSTSVTKDEQIAVLQQAIAAAQKVAEAAEKQKEAKTNLSQLFANHAYCWPEEPHPCMAASTMCVLPTELRTLIFEQVDERFLAPTCSFFRRFIATNNMNWVATAGLEKLLAEEDLLENRCQPVMTQIKRIALTLVRAVSLGWMERAPNLFAKSRHPRARKRRCL